MGKDKIRKWFNFSSYLKRREVFERFRDRISIPEPETKEEMKKASAIFQTGPDNKREFVPPHVIKALGQSMGLAFPGVPAFFVRLQLRTYVDELAESDAFLANYPLDILSDDDLRQACHDRGMRVYERPPEELRRDLGEWLELTTAPSPVGVGDGEGGGGGVLFLPQRAKMLGLGVNCLASVREGKAATLSVEVLQQR